MTRNIFSISLIFMAGLILSACAHNVQNQQQPSDQGQTPEPQEEVSKLYAHPSGEYFFKYPSDWQAVDVNEQGENYVVTTRISSTTQPQTLIDIGQFTGKEEFNNGNIVWRTRDMQRFYDSQKLISVTEIENGKARYVELVFSGDNRDTALIAIPQSPKGFFINVKEGWNTSQQEVIEKMLGSLSFSKDNAFQSTASYCEQKQKIAVLTITPNIFEDSSTKLVIKAINEIDGQPIAEAPIVGFAKYGFFDKTDVNGEYSTTLSQVPDRPRLMADGTPLHPSLSISITSNRTNYFAGTINLKSNSIMHLTYYLPPSKYSGEKYNVEYRIFLDNSVGSNRFIYYKCTNTL